MKKENSANKEKVGMRKGPLLLLAAAIAFGAFLYWRKTVEPPTPVQIAMVWDTSPSVDSTLTCAAMVSMAKERLADQDISVTKKSRLAVVVTGGYASSFEPRLILDAPIPRKSRTALAAGKQEQSREQFFSMIRTTCNTLPRAEGSAIYRSVQMALEHLRGLGCGSERANCFLQVASDGVENGDKTVYNLLKNPKGPLPSLLANSIAQTAWCGYEQVGAGGMGSGQPITAVWARIFQAPVAFRPYCEAEIKTSERRD